MISSTQQFSIENIMRSLICFIFAERIHFILTASRKAIAFQATAKETFIYYSLIR